MMSVLLGFVGAWLASCDRSDKETSQGTGSSLQVNSNSQHARRADRRNDKTVRGSSRKSKGELIEAIAGFDFEQGLTEAQKETISDLIKYYPEDALSVLFNKNNVSYRVGFADVCERLAGAGDEQIVSWLNDALPQLTGDKRVVASYWADMIRAVAKNNPDKALGILLASGLEDKAMESSIVGLLYVTSKGSPDKALDLLARIPDSQKDKAYLGLSHSLAGSDPARSLEFATMMRDSKEKSLVTSQIFNEWLKSDPEQASEKLLMLKGQFVDIALANIGNGDHLVENLCVSNPSLLRDLLFEITPNTRNRPLFEKSLMAMADRNMETALGVLNDLPQGPFRDDLFLKTFSTGGRPDDVARVALLIGSLEGNAKRNAVIGLGQRFSSESVADILTAAGYFGGQEKSSFILFALGNSRSENLEDMVKALAGTELSGALSEKDFAAITEDVAGRLAAEDNAKAISWYDSVPEGQKAAAMHGLAEEMAKDDIVELGKWLNSKDRDANWAVGVSVLIEHLKKTDSEMANTWGENLQSWKESANQK